jgi:hypothetical protein
MTLVNVTPEINWDLDCFDDMCDGYGCETHESYARTGCDSVGCDSTISTYLVELNGQELSVCQWHYHSLKENN